MKAWDGTCPKCDSYDVHCDEIADAEHWACEKCGYDFVVNIVRVLI